MSTRHPNHEAIVAAMTANPGLLVEWAAERIVSLGAKLEWSMDDNFETTETLAMLPTMYGLPPAGGQSDVDLAFYGEAAESLGYETDYDPGQTSLDDLLARFAGNAEAVLAWADQTKTDLASTFDLTDDELSELISLAEAYGECDYCEQPYELASRDGRCGDCGACAACCEHADTDEGNRP